MVVDLALPFLFGSVMLIGMLGFLLTFYVIFDVFVNQDRMQVMEQVLWIGIVLAFNIFGVVVYLVMVKHQGELLLEERSVATEKQRIDELERLQDLKEDGALTEEEFEDEKERLLGDE